MFFTGDTEVFGTVNPVFSTRWCAPERLRSVQEFPAGISLRC